MIYYTNFLSGDGDRWYINQDDENEYEQLTQVGNLQVKRLAQL